MKYTVTIVTFDKFVLSHKHSFTTYSTLNIPVFNIAKKGQRFQHIDSYFLVDIYNRLNIGIYSISSFKYKYQTSTPFFFIFSKILIELKLKGPVPVIDRCFKLLKLSSPFISVILLCPRYNSSRLFKLSSP